MISPARVELSFEERRESGGAQERVRAMRRERKGSAEGKSNMMRMNRI